MYDITLITHKQHETGAVLAKNGNGRIRSNYNRGEKTANTHRPTINVFGNQDDIKTASAADV